MNKEHKSQFEREKMKYRIFVQKNDVSNAMTLPENFKLNISLGGNYNCNVTKYLT